MVLCSAPSTTTHSLHSPGSHFTAPFTAQITFQAKCCLQPGLPVVSGPGPKQGASPTLDHVPLTVSPSGHVPGCVSLWLPGVHSEPWIICGLGASCTLVRVVLSDFIPGESSSRPFLKLQRPSQL